MLLVFVVVVVVVVGVVVAVVVVAVVVVAVVAIIAALLDMEKLRLSLGISNKNSSVIELSTNNSYSQMKS